VDSREWISELLTFEFKKRGMLSLLKLKLKNTKYATVHGKNLQDWRQR